MATIINQIIGIIKHIIYNVIIPDVKLFTLV